MSGPTEVCTWTGCDAPAWPSKTGDHLCDRHLEELAGMLIPAPAPTPVTFPGMG